MIARLILISSVATTSLGLAPVRAGDEVSSSGHYQVGVARVDITPDYPIRLNGFGSRREQSEGVTQRIWAKALAISQGSEPPVVLVTVDNVGVRMAMVDEVADRLGRAFGIPRDGVALTCSHSHTTPKVAGSADNIFSQPVPEAHQLTIDRYTRELTDYIYEAASRAVQDRRPGRLEWAIGSVGFAKNRRTQDGPVDHDLPLLVVRGTDGAVRALYVSYACHCVTLSHNKISGDWAGYAQEALESLVPGATSLISVGAGSDLNPNSGVVGDRVDVARSQGQEIADEVKRLLGGELDPVTGPIMAKLKSIDLPLEELPTREQFESMVEQGGPVGYNAQTQLARLARGEKLVTAIEYPIQCFTFGESLHLVFLSGEVCVDYSLRLKRELKHSRIWVNAYANDFCCYIPSERLVQEGGYGGGAEIPYFALPTTLQAGLEQRIVDEVMQQAPSPFRSEKPH